MFFKSILKLNPSPWQMQNLHGTQKTIKLSKLSQEMHGIEYLIFG